MDVLKWGNGVFIPKIQIVINRKASVHGGWRGGRHFVLQQLQVEKSEKVPPVPHIQSASVRDLRARADDGIEIPQNPCLPWGNGARCLPFLFLTLAGCSGDLGTVIFLCFEAFAWAQ